MALKLTTPIEIRKPDKLLSGGSTIAGIGSCFSQYVMEQFAKSGFRSASNPNGIVYNAYSILSSLEHLEKDYGDDSFIFFNNLWHSWGHHGSFSSGTREELLSKINNARTYFLDTLRAADCFILTASSSVVYRLKAGNLITANCHKYPNHNFEVEILSKEENFFSLKKSVETVRSLNPCCHIVITLSPVRHYPGNLVLNARSKANLLSAIHECVNSTQNTSYFPSYEILLDELRDYRFYADDMLHPSDLARKIIFERFISTFFEDSVLAEMKIKAKEEKKAKHINFR